MMVLLVVALAALATWPVAAGLHRRWTDWDELTYTHGYLIAAVCVYLIWRANSGNGVPATRPWKGAAMTALAGFGVIWVFSTRTGIAALDWVIWPIILLFSIAAAFGRDVARRNTFAIGLLYFATPLWGSANGLFQWATIYVVRGMLRLWGIPAHFSGSAVQIPSGTFDIAGGCSGLNFVLVALALGALLGELRGDGWRMRSRLLLYAGALAIFANWFRVFSIILVGHHTGMRHYLVAESHYGYGWVLFGVAMTAFFMLERRLPLPRAPAAAPAPVSPGRGGPAPVLAVALMLASIAGYQWLTARAASLDLRALGATTETQDAVGRGWQPLVQGFDVHQADLFHSPDGLPVERHRFLFLSQKQGKELGTYGNDPLVGHSLVAARAVNLGRLSVTMHEVRDPAGARWMIAVGYRAGQRQYATALQAQVRAALTSLLQMRSSLTALTVWRAPCEEDCKSAEQRLEHLIARESREI